MNKKGFTLIELLIAASIFLVATLTFAYLIKTGMRSLENTSRLNRAVYALQAQAEELRAMPFSSLLSQNGQSFADGNGEISVVPALADLIKIELELKWDPGKIPLKIITLRSSY